MLRASGGATIVTCVVVFLRSSCLRNSSWSRSLSKGSSYTIGVSCAYIAAEIQGNSRPRLLSNFCTSCSLMMGEPAITSWSMRDRTYRRYSVMIWCLWWPDWDSDGDWSCRSAISSPKRCEATVDTMVVVSAKPILVLVGGSWVGISRLLMETVSGGDCIEHKRTIYSWSSMTIWAFQVVKLWLLDSLMGNWIDGLKWIKCVGIIVVYCG